MKKLNFILVAASVLMAGFLFTGCHSSEKKIDDAQAKVEDARQNLKDVQQDAYAKAMKGIDAAEWQTFKNESEEKIRDNETRISELKVKIKKQGTASDAANTQRIEKLEQKNKDLNARIKAYESSQSEWESFKREFNHDMDEIGQALKDLTVNNTK